MDLQEHLQNNKDGLKLGRYRLERYLDYQKTISGETIIMAQEDYKNQRNKK